MQVQTDFEQGESQVYRDLAAYSLRSLDGSMLKRLDDFPLGSFPSVVEALDEPNGLLAFGGCLSVDRLLNAYRHGIFPWFNEGDPILWWSPDPRWILSPSDVHVSKSLEKRMRREDFEVTFDRAFSEVIRACAEPRTGDAGTWISEAMIVAYERLHGEGHAHSFEAWSSGRLVGGLYGVAIGQVFFGESMFHRVSDGSKVAFVEACRSLALWGYQLIDCQVHTGHLERFGAKAVSRAEFIQKIRHFCHLSVQNPRHGIAHSVRASHGRNR